MVEGRHTSFKSPGQPRDFLGPRRYSARSKDELFPRINAEAPTTNHAFRENGVVEIESEWTARDREVKMFAGPARIFLSPG